MNRCRESHNVQDWLDGELTAERARAFETHLEGCSRCAAEVAIYRDVFASLAREARFVSVADPGPALTERILDRILPSRLRARWVAVISMGYGTASAVSTFAFISWIMQPSTPLSLARYFSEATVSVAQTLGFAFQTLIRTTLQVIDVLALIQIVASRAAPLGRALTRPLWDPMVAAITVAAVLVCAALLWWMRPRRRSQEVNNVGLLFF